MLACTFQGIHNVSVCERPVPELQGPGEALVKVSVAAVCGSDLHPYLGREVGLDLNTTMGHEFVGHVLQVSEGVTRLAVGERVVSAFTLSCGNCWFCTQRLTCRCSHPGWGARVFGWVQGGVGLEGAQAEYVRVPLAESTLVPVPAGVNDEQALLCGDVLATGWFCAERGRISELAAAQGSVAVAVLGLGPVGLMAVVAACELGASQVFAVDTVPERLELAREFGATPLSLAAPQVLETVGSQAAVRLAYELIRPGGTISSVGVHTEREWGFTPVGGYDKNVTYSNGRCPARALMDRLLQFVQASAVDVTRVFTHRVPLADGVAVAAAYEPAPSDIDHLRRFTTSPEHGLKLAEFGISGLWPAVDASEASPYVTFCSGPEVPRFEHRDQISYLLPKLREQWPWYDDTVDELFYAQVFEKHGSCNTNKLSVPAYFSTGLELHRRYPFLESLEEASIVPSVTQRYEVAKLQRIMVSFWGVRPLVKCSCPGGWRSECEEAPLDSILICIDADLNAIDCDSVCTGPGCERTNCKRTSYYPLAQRQGGLVARSAGVPLAA
ncbi:hypothetical protein WJX81_001599 [Elliptochloris bilobata]|uniref:Alcohol dehydrogenase-like N-terminal domain-containing protein n=1 Tax=Elliptochloris bilobata TaxID=381761 RepID=A0AAW1RWF9_9CHLO